MYAPARTRTPSLASPSPSRIAPARESGSRPVMARGFDFARTPISRADAPIQRVIEIGSGAAAVRHATKGGKSTTQLVKDLEADPRSKGWKAGWKSYVKGKAGDSAAKHNYAHTTALADEIHAAYTKPPSKKRKRPNFSSSVYTLAKAVHSTQTGQDESGISLADEDLAVPHRFPYSDLRDNLDLFTSGKETQQDLERWTGRFVTATKKRKVISESSAHASLLPKDYGKKVDKQVDDFEDLRDTLVSNPSDAGHQEAFLSALNSLHGNVPDLGPHSTVNIPVSDRIHPNIYDNAPLSPGTEAALLQSPHRSKKGVALTTDRQRVVTPRGDTVPILKLPPHIQALLAKQKQSPTTITK